MKRRTLLKSLAGAGFAAGLGARVLAAPPPMTSPASFRQSTCRWCFGKIPLADLAREAKAMGLESIELLGPDEWPVIRAAGLTCAVANGPSTIQDGFNRRENHARLIPAFEDLLGKAAAAGIPSVICFSGSRRGQSDEEGLEICAEGLRKLMPAAEKAGVNVLMELLNSRVDHPDYQCDRTPWAVELAKRVGSERFKLLYDIYHMQIMEGDLIRTIRSAAPWIGHYHTAGNPGRHEFTRPDDPQEIHYPSVFAAIRQTGFTGFVAHEFIPTRDPIGALREAVAMGRG